MTLDLSFEDLKQIALYGGSEERGYADGGAADDSRWEDRCEREGRRGSFYGG